MFTSLANFLLGGTQQPLEQEATAAGGADPRLRAVDAEDDWVLIDNSVDGDDEQRDCNLEESTFERLPPFERATIPRPLPSLRPAPTEYRSLSRGSSSSSLPCLSLEESWFLTPPPCFTSAGPVYMETSPLENLLIEHPSMSVYQHSAPPHARLRGRSHSTGGGSSDGSTSSSADGEAVLARPAYGGRRQRRLNGVPLQHQQDKQCVQLRSAQKICQRQVNQVLKRNNMDRSNKAREINSSRNKRQRRSDRQQHLSGANNNRKCC